MSSRRTTARRTRRGYRSSTENLLTEESALESEAEMTQFPEINNTEDQHHQNNEETETTVSNTDILLQALITPRDEETVRKEEMRTAPEVTNNEEIRIRQNNNPEILIQDTTGHSQQIHRDVPQEEELEENVVPMFRREETMRIPFINQNEEARRTPAVTTRQNVTEDASGNMTNTEVKALARELVHALNQNLGTQAIIKSNNTERPTRSEATTTKHANSHLNLQNEANNRTTTTNNNNTITNTGLTQNRNNPQEPTHMRTSTEPTNRNEDRAAAARVIYQQPMALPRVRDIPAIRTPVRGNGLNNRIPAPGQIDRQAETRRPAHRLRYDDYVTTASESEEYSTSQEDYDTVEERFANGSDWREWPWPKMQKAIKTNRRYGGPGPNYRPRAEMAPAREIDNQLERRLEQMEMKMQVQQAKLEQAEAIAEMARKHEASEKSRNETLTAILQSQASNSKTSMDSQGRSVEPMSTDESEAEEEAVAARRTSNDRSRLTKRNRSNQQETLNVQREQIGDNNTTTTDKQATQWLIKPASTSTSTTGVAQLPQGVNLDIPTFDGQNWPAFKNQFEMVATAGNWNDYQKVITLHNVIRGEARNVLSDPESVHWSYQKLVEHLEMRHGRTKSHGDVFIELMAMYRKPNQQLASWNDEVVKVVNSGRLTKKEQDHLKYMGFTYGLRYQQSLYNKVLATTKTYTITEAFDRAYQYEMEHGSKTPSFSVPAKVNMVGAAEAEEVLNDTEVNHATPAEALKKFGAKQGFGLEEKLTKAMTQQFQQLGNNLNQRLTQIDNRINNLERKNGASGFNFNNPQNRYRYDERRQLNQNFNNNRNQDFAPAEYQNSRNSYGYNRGRNYQSYNGNANYMENRDNNTQWNSNKRERSRNSSPEAEEAKPQPQRKPTSNNRGTNQKSE